MQYIEILSIAIANFVTSCLPIFKHIYLDIIVF